MRPSSLHHRVFGTLLHLRLLPALLGLSGPVGCVTEPEVTPIDLRALLGELIDIMDVGFTRAFLSTPYARRLTGGTVYVDGGVHIMA